MSHPLDAWREELLGAIECNPKLDDYERRLLARDVLHSTRPDMGNAIFDWRDMATKKPKGTKRPPKGGYRK